MHLKFILAYAATFWISTSGFSAIQTYEIRGSWANEAECLNTANTVFEAFRAHVSVVSARCQSSPNGLMLQVAYSADAPIETISTIAKYTRVHEFRGGYRSKEECIAKTPGELTVYKTSTGLEPFVAQCFNETGIPVSSYQYNWNLLIEAIGPAPVGAYLPNELAVNLAGYFLTSESDVRKAISDALLARGIRPGMVQAHHANTMANLIKIRAYSPNELDLGQSELAKFVGWAPCLKEADRLNKSAYAREGFYLTTFCMSNTRIKPSFNEYNVTSSLNVAYLASRLTNKDRPQKLPGGFGSFAQCDAQRPAIVAKLEQSIGKPIRASLCGKSVAAGEDSSPEFFVLVIE